VMNNTRKFSTSTSSTTSWQPNQTTTTFTKMQSICPEIIQAYATCVISKQNKGILVQGVCEQEYIKLMDCFKKVRRV
jgi:hypothetical protein